MTEAEYLAIAKRSTRQFKFQRRRGSGNIEFSPENARLHFANRDVDTLELTVPSGFLVKGDKVVVKYSGSGADVTVFRGSLERRVRLQSRGNTISEICTISGPWSKMARLVYLQYWNTGSQYVKSSRLVLNQTQGGLSQDLNSELSEIITDNAPALGITKGTISVSTQKLPFDECRDITVADAIRRELRFFPKAIVAFDYTPSTPKISITRPSATSDASYVADIPKTEREYTYTEHPITGVDLEVETVGTTNGVEYRNISHQVYPVGASGVDVLHATIKLKGASSTFVTASFESITEDIPSDLKDVSWWKAKHPRLANVAANTITITEASRSGSSDSSKYPRIAKASMGEVKAAGLNARVEEFTATAKITTDADEEESIYLSMKFVTTNATGTEANPRVYTWVAESSATTGETIPSGLAKAIFEDRAGELLQERMTIRLGSSLPHLGDACDGLLLQSFDVDCANLTATLNFGQPDHLAPEDMAALLSSFRNKRTSTASTSRSTGRVSDDGDKIDLGGIPPVSSTEFCPGTKSKTTVAAKNGSSGSIKLDSSEVPQNETATMKSFKVGGEEKAKILATKEVDFGQKKLVAGAGIKIETNEAGEIVISSLASGAATTGATVEELVLINGVAYEPSSAYLYQVPIRFKIENGIIKRVENHDTLASELIHAATEETV